MRKHPWNVAPDKARKIQQKLNKKVINDDELGQIRFVGGADTIAEKMGNNKIAS